MKKVSLVLCMVFVYAFAKAETNKPILFQDFVSHQVEAGETVYSISKKYKLSEKEIVKLNPDAKDRIYEGLVLILPSKASVVVQTPQEDIRFKTHRVRRKETLYSISKKYDVAQEVIKKFNKRLYSETLRKGDRIRIPLNYVKQEEVVTTGGAITSDTAPKDDAPYTKYQVKPKETKYGIARIYGITISELEAINPDMGEGLKEGAVINVPRKEVTDSATIDTEKYSFYEVQKGNTIYSLLRTFDMKADELVDLNPTIADGLKEGMILKVPKGIAGSINTTGEIITIPGDVVKGSLLDSLTNFSVKKVALMLPFGLKRVDVDSADVQKQMLKNDRILRLSLDFYSGALMAVEMAKEHGVSTDLHVYDTDYVRSDGAATNARKVETIISDSNFSDIDAVVGPVLSGNFNRAASLLSRRNIPLISPFTQKVNAASNVFQSRPSESMLRNAMLNFLKENGEGKNIIIIADSKNATSKSKLRSLFPNAKQVNPRSGDKGLYLYPDDIPSQISETLENWVILETNDVPLISNVTTNLNTLVALNKVVLFTTNKGRAYDSDEIQHMHLMNLNFHFPSMNKEYSYNDQSKEFIDAYEERYKLSPSEEAIRGFDIMYDTLLRLTYADDLYGAAYSGIETSYIENKFRYQRNASGGFDNDAIFLIKYGEELTLDEVSIQKSDE